MGIKRAMTLVLPAALAVAVLVAACGDDETANNVDVSNSGPNVVVARPNFTPISSATVAPSRTPSAAGGNAAAAAQQISVTARDNVFDPRDVTVQAGSSAALTLRNAGSAAHNWHVPSVKSTDGSDIKTDLIVGGQSTVIVFTIDRAGSYDLLCDVHPVEMRGRLTVR